jgi:hypothetical protein
MPPLLMVNWRAVNRAFCLVSWVVALALGTAIASHATKASATCASRAVAPGTSVCARSAGRVAFATR